MTMTGVVTGSRRVREFSSVPSPGSLWFVCDLESAFDFQCHIFTLLHPASSLLSYLPSGVMVEKRKMSSAPGKPGKPLKITAVGDGMVGKTCLLITYTTKTFPTKYVPTVFDNFADSLTVDGQEYNTTLWDTAGQEDYERLRPLTYTHTDCFLLCFSVNNRTSYDNIQSKWCPELKHHCPNVPIILVGTKSDLRNDSNADCLTPWDGRKLRRKIKAVKYIECSAINQENLTEIFVEAVRSCVKTKVDANCICC